MAEEQVLEPEARTAPRFWERVREYKIIQWIVAYLGAALGLAEGTQLLSQAFDWPEVLWRSIIVILVIGFPLAVTLAWYHGHRGLQRITPGELAIVAALLFIGAIFFSVSLRPSAEDAVRTSIDQVVQDGPQSQTPGTPNVEQPAPTAPPARPLLPNSVAVLPLEDLSPDSANSFYALSMHDEIISKLTQLEKLNVITRDSVLPYTAANRRSLEQVASELGVSSLLVGTFQFVDGRIRVRMQLVDPATRRNLWAEEYQESFADIFAVQASIAMNVANALATEFSAAEQQALERRPTSSPEAYARFLEAFGQLDAAGGSVPRAHELLDEAIQLDPAFADAYAKKAELYAVSFATSVLGMGASADQRDELVRRVREYAARAIALDGTNAGGHIALRTVNLLTWHWNDFRRDLLSGDTRGFGVYDPWGLAWLGESAQATRISERALALDPRSQGALVSVGLTQAYNGDLEAGRKTLRQALELNPRNAGNWQILAYVDSALGNIEEVAASLRTAERLFRDNPIIGFFPEIAYTYARSGYHEDARRVFEEIRAHPKADDLGAGGWAIAYLAVGDKAEALRWFDVLAEKARNHEIDPGLISAMNVKMNIQRDPVLEEPEFVAVLNRVRGDYE